MSVSHVPEVITHSSCRCSSNVVVVLLKPGPKRSSHLTNETPFAILALNFVHVDHSAVLSFHQNSLSDPTMNHDNEHELPVIYRDLLSRDFHHVTKRQTPSLNKDSATESKACGLLKFWILRKKRCFILIHYDRIIPFYLHQVFIIF